VFISPPSSLRYEVGMAERRRYREKFSGHRETEPHGVAGRRQAEGSRDKESNT